MPTSPRSPLVVAPLLALALVVACDKKEPPAPVAASASPVAPAGSASAARATPAASASAGAGKKSAAATKTEGRVPVAKLGDAKKGLAAGRKLAGEKKWAEAVAAFEGALAASPGDPRALAELGYAAYHAGDLDKARATNAKALAAATDPQLKAQVLFNEGLVDEKKNDKEAAKRNYEASLKLRPNAIVEKRLAEVGGRAAGSCEKAFPTIDALCTCLKTYEKDAIMTPLGGAALGCTEKPTKEPTLTALRWGGVGDADDLGEHPWILLAKGADGWRKVAELGTDYVPGAFGVTNEATVDGVTTRTIDGRTVAEITWSQHDYDANMAGLEAETYDTKNVTVCVLGATPKCPVTIPLEETAAVVYPIEPDDDEGKAEVEALKKENPPKSETKTATYAIDATGLVTVTETKGTRPHLAPLVKGVKLW